MSHSASHNVKQTNYTKHAKLRFGTQQNVQPLNKIFGFKQNLNS